MNKTLKSISLYIVGTLCALAVVVVAGTLTPGNNTTSTPTMITLSDIYSKIQNINYSATSSDHTVSTTSSPTTGTFSTLEQVYTLLDDLNYTASDIATGTSIMGVNGTAYVITGTGSGSIATADQIITDYYAYSATGTVIQGAATAGTPALEWSAELWVTTWASANAYCTDSMMNGWTRLPTLGELLSALAGQFIDVPATASGFSLDTYYWSSSEKQMDPSSAWYGGYNNMVTIVGNNPVAKDNSNSFRCVR